VTAAKKLARLAVARRVRLAVELTDVDHALLIATARHLDTTSDEAIALALRHLFATLPRPDD